MSEVRPLLDERKLRYFLAVAECGSVTVASSRLRVAQPSLSQTLRSFERELGVDLFHRTGRGLRISASGQALVAPSRKALRSIAAARDAVGHVKDLAAGQLEIAAVSTLTVDPLASYVGRFRTSFPQITVRISGGDDINKVGGMVTSGECELGLTLLPPGPPTLSTIPLGEHELFLVLPPGTPVASGPLAHSMLARRPLIVEPRGSTTRKLLDEVLAGLDSRPDIAVEAGRDAIVILVAGGASCALLPSVFAYAASRRGALVRRFSPSIRQSIGLVHRGAPLSPAAQAFLTVLRSDPAEREVWRHVTDAVPAWAP